MYERHRPALRRQAARLLYASGHDPEDVLQDVFLRVHTALLAGVVPLEPRAWLSRLVHNACVDELRRARIRPVGDVELDGVPALTAQLPDELMRRAEARALLGDIHRLPARQRSVLVMSAIDGLSHEEVAGHLDTTVETTRSLLARARENLRRTAAARETACESVCVALDDAAAAGVRASEVARRHLWSCSACRNYQRDLRTTPSRLRRLASWSPWGIVAQLLGGGGLAGVQKVAVGACCALVVGGGAVAVPELAVHAQHVPRVAAVQPELVIQEASLDLRKRPARPTAPPAGAPRPAVSAAAPVTATGQKQKAKGDLRNTVYSPIAYGAVLTSDERRRVRSFMLAFSHSHPTAAEQAEMVRLMEKFRHEPPGSSQRALALSRVQQAAFATAKPSAPKAPPKGIATPAPTPAGPAPTPTTAPPVPVPVATPTSTATPAPTAAPVETPTASPEPTAMPTVPAAG